MDNYRAAKALIQDIQEDLDDDFLMDFNQRVALANAYASLAIVDELRKQAAQ